MTLILAMKCNDGVLVIADSVRITSAGDITSDGIKSFQATHDGELVSVAFGGYAGDVGGTETISILKKSVARPGGDLPERLGQDLESWLYEQSWKGRKWQRKKFRREGVVFLFLTVDWQQCWFITANFRQHSKNELPHHQICYSQLSRDKTKWAKFRAAIPPGPPLIADGKAIARTAFELATQLFPNECKYPGTAYVHTPAAIQELQFKNAGEFV